jgi:hypothetical protein
MSLESFAASVPRSRHEGHSDELSIVLHLIASGLVEFSDGARDGRQVRLPYPASLQRGLDKLTILCLQQRSETPASIPDLADWCRRPIATWGVIVPDGLVGPGDTFVARGVPTQVCQEWAIASADVEAEISEQKVLDEVISACRSANAADAYVVFRQTLVERPVLTAIEWQILAARPEVSIVGDHLRTAYLPAPAECMVDGRFHTCAGCGNLLLRSGSESLVCLEDSCTTKPPRIGRSLNRREGVLWLRRELRTFIAAPGRTEIRLRDELERRGLQVDLWPHFDAYDIRLRFPDGENWAVDVKDWVNPFLLARRVRPIPQTPQWTRAFFVFPQSRLRRRDYLRAFRHYCRCLGGQPPIAAFGERQFLARVDAQLKGGS